MSWRVAVVLLLLVVASCDRTAGEPCKSGECADGLQCRNNVCIDPAQFCRAVPRKLRCEREGLCTLEGDECVAAVEQDCKASTRCKEHGYCKLAAPCCSRDDTCPSVEEDPITHVERLSVATKRDAAIDKLDSMYRAALEIDSGDPRGKHCAPLLDLAVPPLAAMAMTLKLPVKQQGKVLELLASSRHPKAAEALIEVLRLHRVDDKPPTPADAAMSQVLNAAADMKLHDAADSVFALFKSLQVTWRKGEVKGFSRALENALLVMVEDAWADDLNKMLDAPIDPDGDVSAWRNAVYRQRTAARALGRIRFDKATVPLFKVALSPSKSDVADAAVEALVSIGDSAAAVAKDVLSDNNDELAAEADANHRHVIASIILATMGREETLVLAQIAKADELGKGRIAVALPWLGASDDVVKAFKDAYSASPLDLPIDPKHRGVAAIMAVAPHMFEPSLVPWIISGATALEGTDTALAPFREAALEAAMKLMTSGQAAEVQELGDLITREKWEATHRDAKAIVDQCKAEVRCYISAAKSLTFSGVKAAMMVGVYASDKDSDAIVDALKARGPLERRRYLALALDKVVKKGGPAIVDRLEAVLEGRVRSDPTIAIVIARLKARA